MGFRVKSDLRNHQAIVQPRLYDSLMVTQITLMASHVTRMQTAAAVVAQMRERRRRELLMQLLMGSNMPLTTQTRQKVERTPNGSVEDS